VAAGWRPAGLLARHAPTAYFAYCSAASSNHSRFILTALTAKSSAPKRDPAHATEGSLLQDHQALVRTLHTGSHPRFSRESASARPSGRQASSGGERGL
jgi:hypothetical protein